MRSWVRAVLNVDMVLDVDLHVVLEVQLGADVVLDVARLCGRTL